jgi:glycosyltransferase involved in cell wall biosynthesis
MNNRTAGGAPKVSVVIPAYNVEKYLPRCVASVLKQTLSDIEILIVNDGSTDGSEAIIRDFAEKDERIVPISQENGGYGSAINNGFKNARGAYAGIVEADDWIAPDMYEKLYALARKTDADIVKANFYHAYSEEKYAADESFARLKPPKPVFSAMAYPAILDFKPTVWSAIYRMPFLKAHQIKMVETPGASFQDFPFTFEAFSLAEKICLLRHPLYFYFQENPGSSVRNIRPPFVIFDHFEYIDRFLAKHEEIRRALRPMRYRIEYRHGMWQFERIEKKHRKKFFRRLSLDFEGLSEDVVSAMQVTAWDRAHVPCVVHNRYYRFVMKRKLRYLKDLVKKYLFGRR